ncbi:hypothetical protein HPP92_010903 [Vanilla planifolia]|uniref:Regulator of Vps4 activity in the MVB pathway protein n=1 Tax=Vanilla planifolia TaxID=51239 RepID=A0A835R1S8_VANPL|nr:hypothetical protein HPP92_010903 [Vanilla planifolia]
MFDGFLGRKFSSKCKHSVKCIRCRMETIRKKKEAMVRYLKKDIADLIACGHEANALGRMDSLIVEINQACCYAMIEQYCCCIVEHLPTMQKDSVCPDDTVEAVATLIFAAARFPDLPELAHLRHLFTERFRTHMEAYVNEEFVEKMQKNSFQEIRKLQLMQDIAKEFTVNWDVKSFEYKLSNPSAPTSVQLEKRLLSGNENDMKSQNVVREREMDTERIVMDNGRKPVLEENPDPSPGASKLQMQQAKSDLKRSNLLKEDKRNNEKMDMNIAQKHLQPESGAFRRSFNVKGYQLDSTQKFDEVLCDEPDILELHQFDELPLRVKIKDNLNRSHTKERIHDSNSYNEPGLAVVAKQGAETVVSKDVKTAYRTPPYTRFPGHFDESGASHDAFFHSGTPEITKQMDQNSQRWGTHRTIYPESRRSFYPKPPYVKPVVNHVKPGKSKIAHQDYNDHHLTDELFGEKTQKPILERENLLLATGDKESSEFNHSKQTEDVSSYKCRMNRTLSEQPRYHGYKNADEEEEMMDKYLMHYSKKGSDHVPGKGGTLAGEYPTGADLVPPETNSQGETTGRRHTRSVSMQPDLWSPSSGRVHPRLPADYGDLAVRIAALRRS